MRFGFEVATRYPRKTLIVAAVAAVIAAVAAARLRPDSSLKSFFARDDRSAQALDRVLNHFPVAEKFLVLAGPTEGKQDARTLRAFGERLAEVAKRDERAKGLISKVEYEPDPNSRDFVTRVVAPNGLFYLTGEQYAAARQRLTLEGMRAQLRADEQMLSVPGPAAGALSKALMQDPLRLHEFLMPRLAALRSLEGGGNSDGFLSADGKTLLIQIDANGSASDLNFCRRISDEVRKIAKEANEDGLHLEYSGAYAIADYDERVIRRDSISSVIGSVAGLLGLFAVCFRRPVVLFMATFAPVALGVLYGFGAFALHSRTVTPLTAVIGSMLAGIGIDYSIFFLIHYLEKRKAGGGKEEAARTTGNEIRSALFAAWFTSVVGFVAVGVGSIQMLRDFSLAGSLSLTGALVCAGTVLPALLVVFGRGGVAAGERSAGRVRLAALVRWIEVRRIVCAAGVGLFLVAAGVVLAAKGVVLPVESSAAVMHPQPNPPLEAEERIGFMFGGGESPLILHLAASSPDELLRLAWSVEGRVGSLREIQGEFGLTSLLPDPRVAERRRAEWGSAMAARTAADFDRALAETSFNPAAFSGYRGFLLSLLTAARAPTVADLGGYRQLAQTILPREAMSGTPATEALTLIFLRPGLDAEGREGVVKEARAVTAGLTSVTITGMSAVTLETQLTIRRDLPRFIGAAVVMIGLYLLVHFRSVKFAALAVLPTACSLAIVLAVARLMDAKMNLANLVAAPLLISIDVDYGIFLVSIARRCASLEELRERVTPSVQSVVLCAAATLVGFGSLALTSVPGIRSLGWAVAMGITSAALSAILLLLPLLMWEVSRGVKREPASRGSWSGLVMALILVVGGGLVGCAAPAQRLSFPAKVLRRSEGIDWYDVHRNGRAGFGIGYDRDGRAERLLYDDRGSGQVDREYRLDDYSDESVPHLVLMLDSIPFETMAQRYAAGDFRWFDPPRKMIAPFPSLTEVCFSDVLRAPPLPGFIDQYFDPRDQQRKDNLWERVKGMEQPWERRLNYGANYLEQGLAFLHPDEWYEAELERARLAFERSPDRVTVVYIASAACMVCKYGKAGAERVLNGARRLCLQLLYERRGAIKLSMMADHGHNYMPSTNVLLDKMLLNAGFHPAERLKSDRDCIIEINALVTCAAIDTFHPDAVATALCTKGSAVEMAIYVDGPRVMVRTERGAAAIESRRGALRYLPIDGDVLGYAPLIARLKKEGKMDEAGFAADEVWFSQTLDEPWPNVPRRAWDAMHGRFINTPSLFVSLRDGYYAGNPSFENYIKMASTHGGMNQVNSATFVMSMMHRLSRSPTHGEVLRTLEPGFEPRVRR